MPGRPVDLDLRRERAGGPKSAVAAPPASSSLAPAPVARDSSPAGPVPRKRTAHKPRRAVVRRRGARVDSESEQDELDRPRSSRAAANRKSRDSDSESDLDVPSSDDEEDSDDDDDADIAEPKTPATASVEQLPQALDPAAAASTAPRQPPQSRKAVLAGQVLHPSWSDMPAPGEDGDTSLPTLDFSNLSLDIVQHLPSPPAPRSHPAVASTSKAQAPPPSTHITAMPGGLSKKQLQEQKRQAKLAALKQQDPEAAERIEAERQERLAAKRLAKKERLKERKRERKALEHTTKHASVAPHDDPEVAPTPSSTPASLPAASGPKTARPPKSARPVVPSRPSRTAVALGLLGPESHTTPPDYAPSALPPSASATTPVVPAASRQPAFLPRDSQGRPIPQSLPSSRPRPPHHHVVDDEHAASQQWMRGRGGAPRGFGSYRGRGAARFAQQERDEGAAAQQQQQQDAEEDQLATDSARFSSSGVRGRGGRGRGALVRGGGITGRGRGAVTGPPGSINPRYAHLPFHPLHRFPSSSSTSAPKSASPVPSNRSTDQASNVGPEEVTTASPDEQLFEVEAEPSADAPQKPTGVVKLPDGGAAQISIAVKGAAAAQAAREHAASKENRPSVERVGVGSTGPEPPKLSDPGILYASEPRRPTEAEEAANTASVGPEARREPLSLLHQVPPHLQATAGPSTQQYEAPVYYQQQQPYSVPYWSSDPAEPYPISSPSPAPASEHAFGTGLAHPAPSSAYFVPPRPNKRVEIKNPSSRDGQSPAPSSGTKSAPPAPVDALEAAREIRDAQILQQQEQQRQAEASYLQAVNYGFQQQQQQAPASPTSNRAMFAASPTFTRDGFPTPANAPLPPAPGGPHPVPHPFPAPPMYSPYPPPPAHVMAPPPPPPTTTYELVAPYPSHYPAAAAYYAPQQPMYQHSLSPPPGAPTGYYGVYGARPLAFEEQPQWTGY
ncbi:hypothetical protein JCM3774_005142 [Rhodotorula dairenensis]